MFDDGKAKEFLFSEIFSPGIVSKKEDHQKERGEGESEGLQKRKSKKGKEANKQVHCFCCDHSISCLIRT